MAVNKLDNRNRLLQEMGLIYGQIMELNEKMTEALQNAVNIDISVTGGVSDITKDFMEGFHYKIDEHARVVSELKKWEYDRLPPVREAEPENRYTDIAAQGDKRTITQEELNRLLKEHREQQEAGNYETLDLSNCIFNEIRFTGKLSGINLMGSELNGCIFENVEMEDSYLSKAEFVDSAFSDCTFYNTMFQETEMGYCEIEYTVYTDCVFSKSAIVACEMQSSGMNGCYLGEAVVSDTKFADTVINKCSGMESIDFSGADKNLRNSSENIFNNQESTFDFEMKPNNEVAVYAHAGQNTIEKTFQVDYNPDTHKIDKISASDYSLSPEKSFLLDRAADMLKMDIQKEFQKQQFDRKEISRFSPCVMVGASGIIGLNENTLYDLKEFSDKISSYERDAGINKPNNKAEFTIMFDAKDGNGVRKWKDQHSLKSDMDSPMKRLENSKRFNNAEISYLKSYINGEKLPAIETITTQPKTQEAKEAAQQKAPAEQKPSAEPQVSQAQKPQNENRQLSAPPKYAAVVYVKGKSDVKTRVTGTSPEKIIQLCQKWNTERASDDQLGTAYIKKYNSTTKAYENLGKYDISKGTEIPSGQPTIYLELPPLGKQEFGKMVSELKANGAKFNPELKKWYVTQSCDLSKFSKYLPKQSEPQIDTKGQQDGRNSVLNGLNQNRSYLDENKHKGNQPQEQQKKKDVQER